MRFQFINKNKILEKLNLQFGIKKVNGIFLKRGAERIFLYQGDLTEKQIQQIEKDRIIIERVGIYFGKYIEGEDAIRLSVDAIHLLQDQITKNILELTQEQFEKFIKGEELEKNTEQRGFLIMKYKKDFIGTGKATQNKITNFIPKNRRIKEKNAN